MVTGSSGHLGEALVHKLRTNGVDVLGLDVTASPTTNRPGSILDRSFVKDCLRGVEAVLHTATLHKPHITTHSRQDFVEINITGTLTLLEEAVRAGVSTLIFTSTTSAFGRALTPSVGTPAVWVTEDLRPVPRNIYGTTKVAAEDLCELFYRDHGLACLILRTARFFPEEDDCRAIRESYHDDNVKANEYLYRRVDLEDVADAHLLALAKAVSIGFGRYILTATTPFSQADLRDLTVNAPLVVRRLFPDYEDVYQRRGWSMFATIERVYVNERARSELGWEPRYDFRYVLGQLKSGSDFRSPLARAVGSKGYQSVRCPSASA
jgi:UDP-glucose 4-epimerase